MQTGRIPPRDWLNDPSKFGRDPSSKWREAPSDPAEFSAGQVAWWQHLFAIRVRATVTRNGLSMETVGTDSGLGGGHVRHIVNGTRQMTLRDLLVLGRWFDDIDVLPPTDGSEPLAPPGW